MITISTICLIIIAAVLLFGAEMVRQVLGKAVSWIVKALTVVLVLSSVIWLIANYPEQIIFAGKIILFCGFVILLINANLPKRWQFRLPGDPK